MSSTFLFHSLVASVQSYFCSFLFDNFFCNLSINFPKNCSNHLYFNCTSSNVINYCQLSIVQLSTFSIFFVHFQGFDEIGGITIVTEQKMWYAKLQGGVTGKESKSGILLLKTLRKPGFQCVIGAVIVLKKITMDH